MNNYIGESIKNLRHEKEVTQEELAEYLHTSFQTVSKWEHGENLPDINTLVSLANYFDVSTDELLRMDKQRSDHFSNAFHTEINNLLSDAKYEEALTKLRAAQRVYPNNIGINSYLANALALLGGESNKEEAVEIYRRVIGDTRGEKVKTSLRSLYFILTKNTMEKEEALQQVRRLTHIWDCREMITAELYSGEERDKYLKWLIHLVVSMLYRKITSGQLSDEELFRTTAIGPHDMAGGIEKDLEMLDFIKEFVSKQG